MVRLSPPCIPVCQTYVRALTGKCGRKPSGKTCEAKRDAAGMKSIVVVGAQWGDEGKGKVVDYMAASFDYIARCAGGHNAGHTVMYDGHCFILQLIPCGVLRPDRHAVIGTGVVVD